MNKSKLLERFEFLSRLYNANELTEDLFLEFVFINDQLFPDSDSHVLRYITEARERFPKSGRILIYYAAFLAYSNRFIITDPRVDDEREVIVGKLSNSLKDFTDFRGGIHLYCATLLFYHAQSLSIAHRIIRHLEQSIEAEPLWCSHHCLLCHLNIALNRPRQALFEIDASDRIYRTLEKPREDNLFVNYHYHYFVGYWTAPSLSEQYREQIQLLDGGTTAY